MPLKIFLWKRVVKLLLVSNVRFLVQMSPGFKKDC